MAETNTPLHTFLVTGGAGFVGSHTTLELLLAGFRYSLALLLSDLMRVIVVDNLCNSYVESLHRVAFLAFGYNKLGLA